MLLMILTISFQQRSPPSFNRLYTRFIYNSLRDFAGLDAGEDAMLDETTIVNFRRLLETHGLAQSLFDETASTG